MLRSIAGLLDRLGQHRDAAVLVGAVQASRAGHRVFGADEVALVQLGKLDGDAAVDHARRAL